MTSNNITKTLSRIAELLIAGADAATAQDYTERMKEFDDTVFAQLVDGVKQDVLKSASNNPIDSAELTMKILKSKYGKE